MLYSTLLVNITIGSTAAENCYVKFEINYKSLLMKKNFWTKLSQEMYYYKKIVVVTVSLKDLKSYHKLFR